MKRRRFLELTAAASGALAWSRVSLAADTVKPLRILILGGTGFTGPYQVRYAVDRGHKITVFNRGKREADLPAPVEHLVGDRNGQLEALRGRKWDVCIDNPTTLPAWVRDAAAVLRGNVGRYIFISTISVYADTSKPVTEETALATYQGADAMTETLDAVRASGFALYGPLKALSEKEAEKNFPGKTLIIRPGLIVGPRDETDRFTYWPVRIHRGGEVLAPGAPGDPVQFIDARDLAEWTIRMAESGNTGIFNATGPAKPLGIGAMLDTIKGALSAKATITWVPADFLEKHKVQAWSDVPVWVPARGEEGGLTRTANQRALERGLTFRLLETTARDTLAWFETLPAERRDKLRAGLSASREEEVLAAWHQEKN